MPGAKGHWATLRSSYQRSTERLAREALWLLLEAPQTSSNLPTYRDEVSPTGVDGTDVFATW